MAKKAPKKKRNPTDATMRNVKASAERIDGLAMKIRNLWEVVDALSVATDKEFAAVKQRLWRIESASSGRTVQH